MIKSKKSLEFQYLVVVIILLMLLLFVIIWYMGLGSFVKNIIGVSFK